MKKNYTRILAILFLLCTSMIGSSQSQDTIPPKWKFLLEPYFMFGSIKGTAGLGNLPDAEVDQSPGDLFEKLKFGSMIYFEAYSDKWAIFSDMIYMKLGADLTANAVVNHGEAEIKQLSWELGVLRKLLPWLEGGVSLELYSMKSSLDMNINTTSGPVDRSRQITETWVDPMIVARAKIPLTKNLILKVRPSIGGFGIGSDLAWQVQGQLAYRFSKLFHLAVGYRIISIDYEKGSGSDRFLYDVDTFGPEIRFGFNF